MAWSYRGRVAVVTGAAGGIGAALVRELEARGADVAAVDREFVRVGASRHRLDVSDRPAVMALPAAVVAAHGRVDVLVNNAGIAAMGRIDEAPLDQFDRVMAVNFGATVAMTKAFLPYLGDGGRIANLSSVFGLIAPAGQAPYVASKFAVRGFTDSLRHELADTGIKVSCVHPGGVRTGIADAALIAEGIASDRAAAAQRAFGQFLRLDPADAARIIADGVATGRARILVGRDARMGDLLARLLPAGYGRILARRMGGMRAHVGRAAAPLRAVL